jgi:hypothetical protein
MSKLTVAYIQRSGKIPMFLGLTTRITSWTKSWSGFNDEVDLATTDRKPPVVGRTIRLPVR